MSFLLICYNQEKFVGEAIRAALAQDYTPLEILISDDASQDGSWSVIQQQTQGYGGPHRLRTIRQPVNLGVAAHVQSLAAQAAGRLLVLAAADDVSMPDRVSRLAREFARHPDLAYIGSLVRFIDENGREIAERFSGEISAPALRSAILAGDPFTGASAAYIPAVFDKFPALPTGLNIEDTVLQFRAALLGEVKLLGEPLVRYRTHASGLVAGASHYAASPAAYREALRKIVKSAFMARQMQLQDLDAAANAGWISVAQAQTLRASLLARKQREEVLYKLLVRHKGAIGSWLAATLRGRLPWRESVKTAAMGLAPSLWYRYIRYRAARA